MAKTILIVEDDDSIRETLQSVLELEGHDVLAAENGQVGLELLKNNPKPCLILLDLMMPVMNGWDFAAALEKDNSLSTIPVIIISAYNEKAIHIKSKAILKKPVDINTLYGAIKEWCGT